MSSKTPTNKSTSAPAKSAGKGPASDKKAEAQQAKANKTPAKQVQKKFEDEDEDDDDDDDDIEEKQTFSSKKLGSSKKADPEDELDMNNDDEDDEDEEYIDVPEIDLAERLKFGLQQGFRVPANEGVLIRLPIYMEDRVMPFHITNACLGPDAVEGDRAVLVLQQSSQMPHEHDHDDDEHDHDHDHDHDENGDEDDDDDDDTLEIVCGVLCKNQTENLPLDLVLSDEFVLINMSENTDIFVTGRIMSLPDDDDDYEEFDDEELEMEDGDEEREQLEDEEDEDEEDEEAEQAKRERAMEMRKRLLDASNGDTAKKAKVEPKVIDVKPAEKKPAPDKKAPAASAPKPEAVRDFILAELKAKKTLKSSELGNAISTKFGMSYKNMGFPEKSVSKFLEAHAKGKVQVSGDEIKLV